VLLVLQLLFFQLFNCCYWVFCFSFAEFFAAALWFSVYSDTVFAALAVLFWLCYVATVFVRFAISWLGAVAV